MLRRLGVLVGQADAAALFGQRTAKAEAWFRGGSVDSESCRQILLSYQPIVWWAAHLL
jgi:hypothetical protein